MISHVSSAIVILPLFDVASTMAKLIELVRSAGQEMESSRSPQGEWRLCPGLSCPVLKVFQSTSRKYHVLCQDLIKMPLTSTEPGAEPTMSQCRMMKGCRTNLAGMSKEKSCVDDEVWCLTAACCQQQRSRWLRRQPGGYFDSCRNPFSLSSSRAE